MKVLSVGGGAREHAIVKALDKSDVEIFSVMKNRNPGIAKLSKDILYTKETEVDKITEWAQSKAIDWAIIGPEGPLGVGIVDVLEKVGIQSVGPSQKASQIEISKQYMRDLMAKHDLPGMVDYKIFDNTEEVEKFLKDYGKQVVVKPIGLTGGKGVKIMGEHLLSTEDVIDYCQDIIDNKIGGSSSFVIEEKMVGEELTLQAFCDGKHLMPMPAVQDHKRAYEGDIGPNTGGMGSYSQEDGLLPFLTKDEYDECVDIMQNIINAMAKEGTPYKGILYGQFILTSQGPKVIECNARFGDPEAMNVLPLLTSDFKEICSGIIDGNLSSKKASFTNKATVCKYIVPMGYGVQSLVGEKVEVNEVKIKKSGAELFYASVDKRDDQIYTTSSRSLAVVGVEDSIFEAEKITERALSHVKGNVFMRHDIGKKDLIEKRIKHMKELRGE
ncbi:MAG: phosphoribosylamine--glycine ligase [Methanomassiliicoccales archaeon]|nr:MAG: phosphoribosylamine--glycine ligase [Methanomassiliicoccales archaeon]